MSDRKTEKKSLGGNMCFHLLSLNEFTVYLMNIPGLIVNGSSVDERKIVWLYKN